MAPERWPRKLWGSLWAQLALHVHSLLVYIPNVASSYHSVITLSHYVAAQLQSDDEVVETSPIKQRHDNIISDVI